MQTAHTKLISKNYTGVLSLTNAKEHLRIPNADTSQDTLITACVNAAITTAEARTERLFSTSVYQIRIEPEDMTLVLPFPDYLDLTKVEAVSTAGVTTTLYQKSGPAIGTLADYLEVDSWLVPAEVTFITDDVPDLTRYLILTMTFGPNIIPEHVLQAIKMLLGHYFDNPKAVVTGTIATELQMGVDRLLSMEHFKRFG